MSLSSIIRRPLLRSTSKLLSQHRVPRLTRLASTEPTAVNTAKPVATTGKPSSMGAFYKEFTRPFLKVFLGALLTYQVLYWSWEKLRTDEIREEKSEEVKALEAQVEELRGAKGLK